MQLKRNMVIALIAALVFIAACGATGSNGSTLAPWVGYPHLATTATPRPWIVLLCKFSDVSAEPADVPDQARMFLTGQGAGTGNMFDYYSDVSYGAITLAGTRVTQKWYQAPFSTTSLPGSGNRAERVKECANAVPAGDVDFSKYYGIIIVTNAVNDGGACIGQQSMQIHNHPYNLACVVFDPDSFYTAFAAHEIGHGLGMPHSYDNIQNQCGGAPGEYCDPWDIMSAQATFRFAGKNYHPTPHIQSILAHSWLGVVYDGPGPSAPNLLQMGWIPGGRIGTYVFGHALTTFTLAALSHPNAPGDLTVKAFVPLSVNGTLTPNPNDYYTVEYRQQDGWDAGIPNNAVIIHEYKPGQSPYSFLLRNSDPSSGEWLAGTTWDDPAHNLEIRVISIDPASGTATISIGPPSSFSTAPLVQIQAPANNSHVTAGIPFQLVARATTYDGHPLPDSAVIWQASDTTIGSGKSLTATLNTPGVYTITVKGTDTSNNLSAGDSITLYADAPPTAPATPLARPTVQIISPASGSSYRVVGFSGSFSLVLSAQGSAGVTTYAWSDSLNLFTDNKANDTLTVKLASTQIPCNESKSDVITITVTDSHGQTANTSVTVSVEHDCLT